MTLLEYMQANPVATVVLAILVTGTVCSVFSSITSIFRKHEDE